MTKCSEVMTSEPACCEPTQPVRQVAEIMARENIGSLPVVESRGSGKLVGIVTDRDIVTKIVAAGRDLQTATAKDAMTGSPASVGTSDDVERALSTMAEKQVRRMPVVDKNGRLTGIIAQADIATRMNRDNETGRLVEAISR